MTAIALTIAGSDSSGGAGIQADLKTFSALGAYGASVLTALTAQNTLGVQGINDVPPDFIGLQIQSVFSDLDVTAVKIGMLSKPGAIIEIATQLKQFNCRNIVLDPVMVSATGDPLIDDEAVSVLVDQLFPLATLVTPNLPEAARLVEGNIASSKELMLKQAEALIGLGASNVLLKGGHGTGRECTDLLWTNGTEKWYQTSRIDTRNTHGTGCTLSSAIAAELAKGELLENAVDLAEKYINGAIRAADGLNVGTGCGPVHHFHEFWN